MFLKKIAVILVSFVFVSSSAIAQTTTSTSGKFTFLNKGDSAPFEGTLFDPEALAKIMTDKKISQKECELKSGYEKELIKVSCKKDTDLLNTELEIETKKYNLIVEAQQEEIKTLRNLAKGTDNTFWTVIGFSVGAAMSIAIFFAATEIAR